MAKNNTLQQKPDEPYILTNIVKKGLNYCSSRGGQNSVFPVVCHVLEKTFYTQHATLSAAHKSIALYD